MRISPLICWVRICFILELRQHQFVGELSLYIKPLTERTDSSRESLTGLNILKCLKDLKKKKNKPHAFKTKL